MQSLVQCVGLAVVGRGSFLLMAPSICRVAHRPADHLPTARR